MILFQTDLIFSFLAKIRNKAHIKEIICTLNNRLSKLNEYIKIPPRCILIYSNFYSCLYVSLNLRVLFLLN